MEAVHVALDVGEGTLLQAVNAVVLQIQLPQGGGVFESSGGDVANVVVVQIEVHEPLQIVKHSVVNNPDIVEAEVDSLQCFKAIEAIPRQVLQ